MKAENIKFKAKALGTGQWVEGFLQREYLRRKEYRGL